MTIEEIEEYSKKITYPNVEWSFYRGIGYAIDVKNSEYPHREKSEYIKLEICFLLYDELILEEITTDALNNILFEAIAHFQRHEVKHFFKVDGVSIFDEHEYNNGNELYLDYYQTASYESVQISLNVLKNKFPKIFK